LFAATGTIFGAGDGETTFNVPDFRGRLVGTPPGKPFNYEGTGIPMTPVIATGDGEVLAGIVRLLYRGPEER
jgi:hypothetical protein